MAHNKAYYFELGVQAAKTNAICTYKASWQRQSWMEGFNSVQMSAKAKAAAAAKIAKAKMAASHPDHGGTCEAFRAAHAEWKRAERYAASL